jgi:transposase
MYVQGENRYQFTFTPLCLDDYIGEDNICRVIDAFAKSIDYAEMGFKYANAKDAGRPAYDPAKMLALYIYGYMNRVRSSRGLEAETRRNVEVMWLMGKLTPDDKTICNFRKDNSASLKKVFREFSLWCGRQGLYGGKLIAIDGTKMRANSSRKGIHSKKHTEMAIASVEKKISEYMRELESNDATEAGEKQPSPETIRDALRRLNEKKDKLSGWPGRVKANGGKEISTVDPDARIMHQGGDGRPLDACYNVQTVADAKHKLIVDFNVSTNPDDSGALYEMTESAKAIMGVTEIAAVADKGYYNGEDIEKCEAKGTTCYIPKTKNGRTAPDEKYSHWNFKYDNERNCYICPEGEILHACQPRAQKNGKAVQAYMDGAVCHKCQYFKECTKDKRGRQVIRSPHQDVLDMIDARIKSGRGRQIYQERQKIIEHPFGTTKKVWGFGAFLCRTAEKTTGEQSLAFLAYNLRRVVNIFKKSNVNPIRMLT